MLQFAAQTETRCPVVGGDGFVPVFREELAALGPAGCGRPVFTPGFAPARVALAAAKASGLPALADDQPHHRVGHLAYMGEWLLCMAGVTTCGY